MGTVEALWKEVFYSSLVVAENLVWILCYKSNLTRESANSDETISVI